MINIKDISFSYPSKQVLNDICFDIEKDQCVAVLGNNGCGKSTLLKCMNGIYQAKDATVYVCGEDVLHMHRQEAAKRIAYVAQQNEGYRMTVFDTVLLGRKPYIKWDATKEDHALVEEIIRKMGLETFKLRYVDELSGGEMQKVMLARALAQQPKFLLLDEPTSNLDPRNQYEVLKQIRSIAKEQKIAVAIVIHDLNLALRYCDRFLFVKEGEIYAYGGVEIMTADCLEAVYEMPVEVKEYKGVQVVIPMPEDEEKYDNKRNKKSVG